MKKYLALAAFAAASASPAFAQNFDVNVGMGDSGYYGRIDIGNFPAPAVVNTQPVIIQQQRVYVEPVYLRAPEGHRKQWSKHCGAYNACGRPVYFVKDSWYQHTYRPRYVQEHSRGYQRGRDWDRNDRRDDRRDDHRRG